MKPHCLLLLLPSPSCTWKWFPGRAVPSPCRDWGEAEWPMRFPGSFFLKTRGRVLASKWELLPFATIEQRWQKGAPQSHRSAPSVLHPIGAHGLVNVHFPELLFSYNSIFQFQFEFQFKFPIISISANNYGSMSVIHNGGKAKLEKLLTSLEKRDFQLWQVKELSSKMYLMDTHHSAFPANWTKLCRGKALKIMPWSSQWV